MARSDVGSPCRAERLQQATMLLNHLPLLVVHPSAELLKYAAAISGLDQLWHDAQRLIAIGDPLPP